LKNLQKNFLSEPEGAPATTRHFKNTQSFAFGDIDNKPSSFRASKLVEKHRKNQSEAFSKEFTENLTSFRKRDIADVVLTKGEVFSRRVPATHEQSAESLDTHQKKTLLYTRHGTMVQNDRLNVKELQQRNIPYNAKHRIVNIARAQEQRLIFKAAESITDSTKA
jgi:hypothetical protein